MTGHPEAAIGSQIRHADRAGEAGGAGFRTEQTGRRFRAFPAIAVRNEENPRNEMSVGQRLFWIAAIAIGAAFSAGMYLAGLESLARLLRLAKPAPQISPTATRRLCVRERSTMRKQMIENAAFEVATQVRTVEDSIEAALAEIAELQAGMVAARVTRAGFATSHAAFEQLARDHRLIAARGGIGNCHVALVETQKTIPGLRTVAFGDEGECPPKTAPRRSASSPDGD